MARHEPTAAMEHAVTAFVRALPEERRDELRRLLRGQGYHGPERASASDRAHAAGFADFAGFGWDDVGLPGLDGRFADEVGDEVADEVGAGDDGEDAPGGDGDRPRPARSVAPSLPLPVMSAEAARAAADAVMLETMQRAGRELLARPGLAGASPSLARAGTGHVVRLSEVAPAALRWLSPGRLAAGKITVLDGDPGLGKSTLLCELAARISQGEALPGGVPHEPRGVVLLSAEDDLHDTIRPRLDAAGGDPRRVISLVSVPDGSPGGRPFAIPGDGPLLEEIISRGKAALVIIDPLVAYLHGGLSANSDQDVRRALAALKTVGENTGAAIVVVRHLNKSSGANPLYRGGGSIGIIGAARCGLLLAADPDDPDRRILAATKGNLGRPPASLAFRLVEDAATGVARVVWEGETRWTAGQLLRAAEEGEGSDDRAPNQIETARAWLREALADGPRPATEIQAEATARSISAATLKQARKAEGITARKEQGRNGRWMLALVVDQGHAREEDEAGGSLSLGPLSPLRPLTPDSEPSRTHDAPITGGVVTDGIAHRAEGVANGPGERCVACGELLAAGRGPRCAPCLAKALTDDY